METNLWKVKEGEEHIVRRIETGDEELDAFLFSLGCYKGEPIKVISRRWRACTVAVKNARYCIDSGLAKAIIV